MAGKTVSFGNTSCNLCDTHIEHLARWLSCNGEVWGVGPTAVFASAAALFLFNELEATLFVVGDQANVSLLEKTLVSTMVLGMLALMVHLWVCCMRFFQYYLDTLIKDSPNVLLEMTTAGLLGGSTEMAALGPLTRFLRTQQPQIHITLCWFLSLCYADYVRKNYCHRFNMPYLEQWQAEVHTRVSRTARTTVTRVRSFVGSVHRRLTGLESEPNTVRARHPSGRSPRSKSAALSPPAQLALFHARRLQPLCVEGNARSCACAFSHSPATPLWMPLRSLESTSRNRDAIVLHRSPATPSLPQPDVELTASLTEEKFPWRSIAQHPLVEWAKCGESYITVTPTFLWLVGVAALAQRVLTCLFRRFLFRRVPLWEQILQNLLFIWMVIYSLHFWEVLVKIVKLFIAYCYEDAYSHIRTQEVSIPPESLDTQNVMQQWVIWFCSAVPLAVYIHTRPRPDPPAMMIWITTNPWQRREMGPYGYYLNRPLSELQAAHPGPTQTSPLRRAFSDSTILIKEPPKRKRHSKSI